MISQVIALTALIIGVSMMSYWVGRAVALNQLKKHLQKYLIVDRMPISPLRQTKPKLYVFEGGKKSDDRTSK